MSGSFQTHAPRPSWCCFSGCRSEPEIVLARSVMGEEKSQIRFIRVNEGY